MIIGDSNRLAYNVLRSNAPRVFLYGPSGTGKTYLAKALAKDGDVVIDILPGDPDIMGITAALEIDHPRIIVTSYAPLRHLALPDRLVTRLANFAHVRLDAWTRDMLAELAGDMEIASVCTTPGQVFGIQTTLAVAAQQGMSREEALRHACGASVTLDNPATAPDYILHIVSELYKVSVAQMLGHRRTKVIAEPRHIALYLMKEHTRLPLIEIGARMGGRDHSTVLHAVNKIKNQLHQKDAHTTRIVEVLQAQLRAGVAMSSRIDTDRGNQ